MIENDKQLEVTKDRLKEFSKALYEMENREDIDIMLREVQCAALKSHVFEFKRDISLYETGEADNPYGRKECVFHYCPNPEICKKNKSCIN